MATGVAGTASVVRMAWVVCMVIAANAYAYNPPVDTAGPLTVRIEGPEEVSQLETPVPVRVVLQNKGEAAIRGTIELKVIDRWRAAPSGPVEFKVGAKGSATQEFTISAGKGTYSAHYPVHAHVRFQSEGQSLVAHPIRVFQTKFESAPPASSVSLAWEPFSIRDGGQLALWQLPFHRSVVEIFGQKPQTMPVGWQGAEAQSQGSLHIQDVALAGEHREAVLIHPPWAKGRVGTLAVEYPLQLPTAKPIVLEFANGMTPDGQSDGVTFRVRVAPWDAPAGTLGEVAWERHSAAKTWQPAKADLSRFAGQKVRLQLESHPGPKNNTGWDQSYWAEPTLVCGTPPQPAPFPPAKDDGSRVLGKVRCGEKDCTVRLWPGERGALDAVVGFTCGDQRLFFRGFEVRVLGARLDDPRSPIVLEKVQEEPGGDGYQARHRFRSAMGTFDVVGRLWTERDVLRVKFHLENAPKPQPWRVVYLEDVAAGPWSRPIVHVYAGPGNVIRRPEAFDLSFDGHRLATSFVGLDFEEGPSMVQGSDLPPTQFRFQPEEKHASLHVGHEGTLTLIPARNVWDGARVWRDVNDLKASGGVEKAAGRFAFDLWGGHYGPSAEALGHSVRYGLTDSMVVWHNWQRWGYDYRLPEIVPPNPALGSTEDMKRLIGICREAGVPFALHDNYIDFYPNAEGFSYEREIAFHERQTPVRAWLNEGRGAQSYRYRADRIEPYLRPNLQWIREHLAPTAYFIDVWSSASPYDYWTADGQFFSKVYTRDVWRKEFAWIREFLGNQAPQISESGHDQLIGYLDGAQTNHLRVGQPGTGRDAWTVWNIRCEDAERTPWFDAAHHDRFILHGAGYSSRYQGGLDARLHGIFSDDYIATEVLTGHPGMAPSPFGRDVVRKYWLLSDLMRALAMKRIETVEYADGDLHRQHVRWSGGGEVWVNRGQRDWDVTDAVLPAFGFLARVPTDQGVVGASVVRRDGVIVEMARSPDRLYVNGRHMVDGPLAIGLAVEKSEDLGERRFRMDLRWQADAPIPAGWTAFLHLVDPEGEILFQASQQPSTFEREERGAVRAAASSVIPEDLMQPGAKYELRAGIYHRASGERLPLAGNDDGDRRLRIGHIEVKADGGRATGIGWKPLEPQPDPILARMNPEGRPIAFGPVTTPGACRLTRDGDCLVVTGLPQTGGGKFPVAIHWSDLPWGLPVPTQVKAVAADGSLSAAEPVRREGGVVRLTYEPSMFQYRLERSR
ncbi:MAG: hypothetical protein HUU20_00790 [Pirellulales bacterium]|nr:hypothetical protein [Pirellulales bacterium]